MLLMKPMQLSYLLMCSDGLTNMVSDDEIRRVLSSSAGTDEKTRVLVDTANENGGIDNIAVLVISADSDEV